jgi:hypothetical protein
MVDLLSAETVKDVPLAQSGSQTGVARKMARLLCISRADAPVRAGLQVTATSVRASLDGARRKRCPTLSQMSCFLRS